MFAAGEAGWGIAGQVAKDVYEFVATGDTNMDVSDYVAAGVGGAAKGLAESVGCIGPCGSVVKSITKTITEDLLTGQISSFSEYTEKAAVSVFADYAAGLIVPGENLSFLKMLGKKFVIGGIKVGTENLLHPVVAGDIPYGIPYSVYYPGSDVNGVSPPSLQK